jgi:hypothetical protein
MIQGCSQHRRFTRYLGKMLVNHPVCWLLVETYFLLLEPLFVNFNLFFSRTEFLANINAVPPGWDMAQNGKWVYSWNYPLDLLNSVRSQGLPASIGYIYICSGWWLTYPFWKKWLRQLGWCNSQYMESHKIHVPNHQPAYIYMFIVKSCQIHTWWLNPVKSAGIISGHWLKLFEKKLETTNQFYNGKIVGKK